MTQKTLKIAIPMAGLGTRMRPHTWSKPKPLISLAGKTVLDYVLDQFRSVPAEIDVEYIFIVGPQGDQVREFMEEHHPDKKVHYVLQAEMRGQSDAIYLCARISHRPDDHGVFRHAGRNRLLLPLQRSTRLGRLGQTGAGSAPLWRR